MHFMFENTLFSKVSTMLLILKSKCVITFAKQNILILFLMGPEDHFTVVIFSDLNSQIHISSSFYFHLLKVRI